MRPFDLFAAKRGEKVCTRDGRFVRNLQFFDSKERPVFADVQFRHGDDRTLPMSFLRDGRAWTFMECGDDLVMLDEELCFEEVTAKESK